MEPQGKRILIVDDEPIIAEGISEILRAMGFFICGTCVNGPSAISMARSHEPDLILMDINLEPQGMDGVTAACIIRATQDIPVIFFTGHCDDEVLTRAKEAEPIGFIAKPFDKLNLRRTVEIALHKDQVQRTTSRSLQWLVTGLRSIRDGVMAFDREGKLEFMNLAAEEMLRSPSAASYGLKFEDIITLCDPAGGALTQSPVSRVLAGTTSSEEMPYILTRLDDEFSFPVAASASPILTDEMEVTGAIFVFRDVSIQHRVQELEKASLEQLESEVVSRARKLQQTNETLKMEAANRQTIQARLNQRISLDVLAMDISNDLIQLNFEGHQKVIHRVLEKLRDHLGYAFAAFVDVNHAGDLELMHLAVDVHHPLEGLEVMNGKRIPRSVAIPEDECVEIDLTASSPNGPLLDVLYDQQVKSILLLKITLPDPSQQRLLILGQRQGGATIPRPFAGSTNGLRIVLGRAFETIQHLEEKQDLEWQLLQSQKMEAIGKLSGGIAHDFNNLLVPIMGYAEMLIDHLGPDDPVQEDAEEIRKAAVSASALTSQMLAFSRKQLLSRQTIDVAAMFREMEKMLRRVIGENIRLRLFIEDGKFPIMADVGQLQQVLMNLCVNARDAMSDGGELSIAISRIEDEVCIEVGDTGTGMPLEIREQIFDPFFSTKGSDGTGLGLSVVFSVVQQHGGEIRVTSEEAVGTTFHLRFPASEVFIEEEPREDPRPSLTAGRGKRILLVEDEFAVLRFLRGALKKAGYELETAETYAEGLRLYKRRPDSFDLIFSDAVLPDGNGLDLIDYALAQNPDTRVILCSGYTDRTGLLDNARSRNITFLQKPFSVQKLYSSVSETMNGCQVLT